MPNKNVKKILIVEDEGDICLILNIMLDNAQTELDHVNTLAKATEHLKDNKVDLVVLDNKLPDGLGLDYLKDIKAINPDQKVLMISGLEINLDKAKENGADDFLAKPFSKQQVFAAVEKLLGR